MSSSQHKQQTPKRPTDFLCKFRYRNVLPPIPFAPKLLVLPSSLERFTQYQSTTLVEKTPLAAHMPLDMGISLEQATLDYLEGVDNEGYNGPLSVPSFDPSLDAPLMQRVEDPNAPIIHSATPPGASAGSVGLMRSGKAVTPKTWLHRTKYIASEQVRSGISTYREHIGPAPKIVPRRLYLDVQAQIAGIERTFDQTREQTINLATLKHPLKHNLTAVESYPILPNFTTWPTNYSLIQFDENPAPDGKSMPNPMSSRPNHLEPGPSGVLAEDLSETGCLMPVVNQAHEETVLVWYLPAGEEDARRVRRRKMEGDDATIENPDDQPPVLMRRIRDYNFKNIPAETPYRQFVFTLEPDNNSEAGPENAPVVRYAQVRSRLQLKKRRPQARQGRSRAVDEWAQARPDILEVRFRGLSEQEAKGRDEKLAELGAIE